jgi:DNA invertase Pin-like site-specific DNA recombinase
MTAMTSTNSPTDTMPRAVITLRLSDFRDDDESGDDTFAAREAELRQFCAEQGYQVFRVALENDTGKDGKLKGASAYKRPVKVTGPDGLITFRTRRPVWAGALLDLQQGRADVLVCEDMDRACRDFRDLSDLLDAVAVRRASAVSPSGSLRLTRGGTADEIEQAHDRVKAARKQSADTSRRVAAGRKRWAPKGSYFGGRRPFGYVRDEDAPQHRKTLIIVPGEAEVIRDAAAAVLRRDKDGALRAIARRLRDAGEVPTVTGVPWSAEILRDVLLKPAVAGILMHRGTEHPASWDAILDVDTWRSVVAVLCDPERRTSTSNAPKWLMSGQLGCGCDCGECRSVGRVNATGGRDHCAPGYTCRVHSHVRRSAVAVDDYVSQIVVERMRRKDARDLFRPAPRAEIDAPALRSEAARLRSQLDGLAEAFADGLIDRGQLAAGTARIKARDAEITSLLSAHDTPDPLAEFRTGRDPGEVWKLLSLERRRAIVGTLLTATLRPVARGRSGFDPDGVEIDWKVAA